MKKLVNLTLALLLGLAFAPAGLAQEITISDASSSETLGADYFTTDTDGVSTLSTASLGYVSNLSTAITVPNLDLTGSGWVFNTAEGTLIVANTSPTPAIALGDPSVSYSYYFVNTTGNNDQPFSMQFTATFPDTTFDPSQVRATFAATLTDGSPGSGTTSSTATLSQTAILGEVATAGGALLQSTSANVDLGPVTLTANDGQSSATNPPLATPGASSFITGPSGGPYNELVVTVAGTYSQNAFLSVSGRVDANAAPEPSSFALFAVGALAGLVFHWRRNAYRQS
jgi:hypothetical protein